MTSFARSTSNRIRSMCAQASSTTASSRCWSWWPILAPPSSSTSAAWMCCDHSISAGDVVPLCAEHRLLWFPLTSIASFWSQFQLGLAASERVFALMDAEPRVQPDRSTAGARAGGRVEFARCVLQL